MIPQPSHVFTTCQIGAERSLKAELARTQPAFRFAYSRPGFLTFKVGEEPLDPEKFVLRSVFARSFGFTLGKVNGNSPLELAEQAWRLIGSIHFDRLHVWQRDLYPAGDHGYEPGPTEASRIARDAILTPSVHISRGEVGPTTLGWLAPTQLGDRVLDVIVCETNEWWLGWHYAESRAATWTGGICPVVLPPDAVSRAYLKMEEGLLWSELPIQPGDHCAEVGCSPGGASQALLNRGAFVLGIDPAEVDPRVAAHPHFTHVKKRGADLRRRDYREIQWLMADMNVAPAYTLDTVEEIVTHADVDIGGLLLTLKLLDWKLADEIPSFLERIRSWGYRHVSARQLSHNRQEICVAARRKV